MQQMWIMIAGPYRSGSSDPKQWKANLSRLNEVAWQVFQKGHIPVIGVNIALPVIEAAGAEHYEEIMMPLSLALAEKCDAILRIEGISSGADKEVRLFEEKGLPVYHRLEYVPVITITK